MDCGERCVTANAVSPSIAFLHLATFLSLFWLCENLSKPTLQWNNVDPCPTVPALLRLPPRQRTLICNQVCADWHHLARTCSGGVARSQHEERSLIGRILPCKGGTKFCSYKKR